jgi:outer membrane protein OmpA-like peptidoglycan-associated protein
VPPSRIAVRYFGDQYPVADSLTDAGRAQNRRATVEILN